MLRTMANVVNLLVCRPHDENFRKLSTTSIEVPVPPMRSSFNFKHQQYMNQLELSAGVSFFFTSTLYVCSLFIQSLLVSFIPTTPTYIEWNERKM